jgi:hypothetical protein
MALAITKGRNNVSARSKYWHWYLRVLPWKPLSKIDSLDTHSVSKIRGLKELRSRKSLALEDATEIRQGASHRNRLDLAKPSPLHLIPSHLQLAILYSSSSPDLFNDWDSHASIPSSNSCSHGTIVRPDHSTHSPDQSTVSPPAHFTVKLQQSGKKV